MPARQPGGHKTRTLPGRTAVRSYPIAMPYQAGRDAGSWKQPPAPSRLAAEVEHNPKNNRMRAI